jgi:hypothetical protein
MGLFTGVNVYLKNIIRNTDNLYDRMVEINEMVVEPLMESGLSRAEAVAETVLGLLRIGEGEYVTEELLKDADKSYLVDNYDLALDEISTLARAREQGFDLDNPMYRGRADDRGSPETLRARKVYTVDDPSTALTYSQKFENLDYDSRYEILENPLLDINKDEAAQEIWTDVSFNDGTDELVKSGMIDKYVMRPSINESGDIVEPIVIDAQGNTWGSIPVNARASIGEARSTIGDLLGYNENIAVRKILESGAEPTPNLINKYNQSKFSRKTSTDEIGKELDTILEKYGDDLPSLPKSLVYENIIDEGPLYQALIRKYMGGPKPATVRMDLDKSVIRKAYDPEDKLENRPRFDSRLRHLKNLLASSAPVAVSLGALSDLKEEPQ